MGSRQDLAAELAQLNTQPHQSPSLISDSECHFLGQWPDPSIPHVVRRVG